MIRRAMVAKLKPGAFPEYIRMHENLWPELAAAIAECGIKKMVSFEDEPYLFLYAELENEDAYDRLAKMEVWKRWGETQPSLVELDANGNPQVKWIRQIWNFDARGRFDGQP
ncbi:MAG: L-rhamnose mutarotase [Chloroflexi bacterium]|nr:L-rhamnose mutarotase [Chloroflexota bacterium]